MHKIEYKSPPRERPYACTRSGLSGLNRRRKCATRRVCAGFLCRLRRLFCKKLVPFAEIALGTQRFVLHIVFHVNGHLCAFKHKFSIYLAAVEHCLAPALADGFHLFDVVGKLQQTGGTGKTLQGKIRPQAVADDRHVQRYSHHEKLFGLP